MSANIGLAMTHILGVVAFSYGTFGLYRYYKTLTNPSSELFAHWVSHSPRFLTYMKWFIPLILIGFILNTLNSSLALLLILVNGPE